MDCSAGEKGRSRSPAQVQGGNAQERAAPHRCGTSPNRLGATPSPQSSRGSLSSGRLWSGGGDFGWPWDSQRPLRTLWPIVGEPAHGAFPAGGVQIPARCDAVECGTSIEDNCGNTGAGKTLRIAIRVGNGNQLVAEVCHRGNDAAQVPRLSTAFLPLEKC